MSLSINVFNIQIDIWINPDFNSKTPQKMSFLPS